MNKLVVVIAITFAALSMPKIAVAQYGQEVKGVTSEETVIVHKPVEAGIEDPIALSAILGAGSYLSLIISKRIKRG